MGDFRSQCVVVAAFFIAAGSACAQSANKASAVDSASGLAQYEIKPSDLPPPKLENEVNNPPRVIPKPEGAKLTLPPGFEVATFAEGGFIRPRWMALAPNGDVFLADSDSAGKIIVLRDTNHNGVADQRFVFAENQLQPFGLAFWKDYLYVGNTNAIVRFHYRPGQTKADRPPEQMADLPGGGYRG